jgi:hypothetical protein
MNLSISSSKRLVGAYFVSCLGVLAMLVGASEWLVRAKVLPADTLQQHVVLFEQTSSPYVAFGDSHVARDFDAQAPVVNLAYPSENIEKIAWKAARYLQQTPHPETVLVQADPHLFAKYRTDAGLEDYPRIFGDKAGSGMLSLSNRYRPQLIALWQAFARGGGHLKSSIVPTPQGALLSPGNLASWSAAKTSQFTKARISMHIPALEFEWSRDARLYHEIVRNFVDAGADVCLVAFPTSPAYRAQMALLDDQAKSQWAKAMAFFAEIAEQPNVDFIDHRARFNDPSLFRDPDHLNKDGAIKYGPILQSACFSNVAQTDVIASVAASNR